MKKSSQSIWLYVVCVKWTVNIFLKHKLWLCLANKIEIQKMHLWNSFQSIVVRDERGLLKIIAWFHAKSFFDLESVNLKLLRHHQQSIPHLSRDHVCCVHNPQTYNWLLGFCKAKHFWKRRKKIKNFPTFQTGGLFCTGYF